MNLGTHYRIGDTLIIPAQTKDTSGTPTDADSLPTYQIYEQGGTTAIASGSFAKRDDANTTGYYEASISLTTAAGYEYRKAYEIRKLATVSTQDGVAIDTFVIGQAGATTVATLSDWPQIADIDAKLDAVGITLRADVTDDYKQLIINAVVADFENYTKREYVAGSEETRYYDGSGTGRQIVDAMVSLTTVELIGYSSDAAFMTFDNVALQTDTGFPQSQLIIRQGSYPPVGLLAWSHFPQGRQNIAVTGVFGYGEAIPQDVWEAVAGETVRRLAEERSYDGAAGGDPSRIKQGPVEFEFGTKQTILDTWGMEYKQVRENRRRPFQDSLRNFRPAMV